MSWETTALAVPPSFPYSPTECTTQEKITLPRKRGVRTCGLVTLHDVRGGREHERAAPGGEALHLDHPLVDDEIAEVGGGVRVTRLVHGPGREPEKKRCMRFTDESHTSRPIVIFGEDWGPANRCCFASSTAWSEKGQHSVFRRIQKDRWFALLLFSNGLTGVKAALSVSFTAWKENLTERTANSL
jgi:hypothetical protein